MTLYKNTSFSRWNLIALGALLAVTGALGSEQGTIRADTQRKVVEIADGKGQLALRLSYDGRCVLDRVLVRGRDVAGATGVATGVRVDGKWLTSRTGIETPTVSVGRDTVTVKGIIFGKPGSEVRETWKFTTKPEGIAWRITRRYSAESNLEDAAFPEWNFSDMSTWTGGMLDNGGVVWSKYLEKPDTTYGAHAGTVTFWSREHGDCLRVSPSLDQNQHGAVRFSHQKDNSFSFDYVVAGEALKPKHDLRRFLAKQQDLWAPFRAPRGEVSGEFLLQALDYDQAYHRGQFAGLDGASIRELLNTVGRYGVIDSQLVGANGWRSGYICLHEQWFAQIGLALADPDYIANFSSALDYERDHAIGPDGRVKSRWCYTAGDAMPGTFDRLGFYEAQWGWLMDSQPDYVMNVVEQFDLTGDHKWLAGQKAACERALDFMIRREVGHSGLVAMMTDSCAAQRGSDWIDIIWASYENALINAELYYALKQWSAAERTLGEPVRAAEYDEFANRLKTTFNKSTTEGGFWSPINQWYAYWRDKDGSIHGDNLVTPVNFAAIAYGLCDDPGRRKAILDRIETEMCKENLFYWPLNFFPYRPEEGKASNFPFPKYENGDLFLSWGELGVRAYAAYDPALALKYIKNTLDRYNQDGLSFQRYLRNTQRGEGGDILAGNCMPIVGLYRDVYGIQPKPNRLYIEPKLTRELNGTKLVYPLRGQVYELELNTAGWSVTANGCTVRDTRPFGLNAGRGRVEYFPGGSSDWAMLLSGPEDQPVTLQIESWPEANEGRRCWTETSAGTKTAHLVMRLHPNAVYELKVDGRRVDSMRADVKGSIKFTRASSKPGVPQRYELVQSAR